MYEPHNVKPKLTSRIIKIEKHEFICNLRFCNVIILFVTTCIALEYIIENACKDDLEKETKDITDQQWNYSRKCEATKLQSQINHRVYLPHQCSF